LNNPRVMICIIRF